MKIRLNCYFLFLMLLCLMGATDAMGATISGTVYGVSPPDYAVENAVIRVYTGDPCQEPQLASTTSTARNGQFFAEDLPGGRYYIQAQDTNGEFLTGWYSAGNEESSVDCGDALPLDLAPGETKGVGFMLQRVSTLKGTVLDQNNQPVSGGGYVDLYSGDPCNAPQQIQRAHFNEEEGAYVFITIPEGSYYLKAEAWGSYVSEWYGGSISTSNCLNAQLIEIIETPHLYNFNFQLNLLGVSYTLTTNVEPVASGSVIGGGVYNSGDTTTLIAQPENGYEFSHWTSTGSLEGTANPVSIEINADLEVTAHFRVEKKTNSLLLDVVPYLAAHNTDPLAQIKKISGDWFFTVQYNSISEEREEFRFYQNTATQKNTTVQQILGDQFLANFDSLYVDAVTGTYDNEKELYTVISLWGPPEYDSGSAYLFKAADKNTPNVGCHYFTDGQGNINDYYKGWGGTLDCNPLTITRRTGSKIKSIRQILNQKEKKQAMRAKQLANIRRNMRQKK